MVDTHGLLTKCEVKIAGYWPSSFSACLWTEAEPRRICFILSAHGASHIFDKVKLLSVQEERVTLSKNKFDRDYLGIHPLIFTQFKFRNRRPRVIDT